MLECAAEVVLMQRWLKGALLAAAGAGALAALYARFIERATVTLDRYTITVDKPGLPAEGLTILHLSDLHCRAASYTQRRKLARLESLLADEQYDLLALTGDLIHDEPGLPAVLRLVEGLQPRLAGFSCPGNHDYWESSIWGIFGRRPADAGPWRWSEVVEAGRKLLEFVGKVIRNERVYARVTLHDVPAMHAELAARGVQPLVNRAYHLQAGGADLWIAGVDDLTQGASDLTAALADAPTGALLLVLAHNPDVWIEPGIEAADLVLAGHTHGGQVRLPFIGAIHTQGTHMRRRRPAGWFQRGASQMFVSRGVGESLPLRLGVPPQAALIRIKRTQEPVCCWPQPARTSPGGRS
jgi:predicted MPP superfamily phosphohydrolase